MRGPDPDYEERCKRRFELHEQGYNDREIAEIDGSSPNGIFKWRKKFGLPRNGKCGPICADMDLFMKYYMDGLNDREIGERLFLTRSAVAMRRKKLDLPPNYWR